MTENKKIIIIACIVALSSQLHFNFFMPGFIITLSVIMLGSLIYIMEVDPVKTGVLTAIVSPLFRGIVELTMNGDLGNVVYFISPDIIFYLIYTCCFFFFYRFINKDLFKYFLLVLFSELTANIFEIGFRVSGARQFTYETLRLLIVIALIRSIIVVIIIVGFKYYQLLLTTEEHDNRYRKLLMKKAYFESEIYFMKKNIDDIEKTMKQSYKLYKLSQEYDSEISKLSLDIAKNIHEVKKDYIRVVDGLNEISDDDSLNKDKFNITEVLNIVKTNSKDIINTSGKMINLQFNSSSKKCVTKHFLLMSVLRNLIDNSIDAIEDSGNITIKINECNDFLNIIVFDNGTGIDMKHINYIFQEGFSSKFNDKTGKSNRGLGLTLIKEIIENNFKGKIIVTSELNKWTQFEISIPSVML